MGDRRITHHPILRPAPAEEITVRFRGEPLAARDGETIAAALTAAGVRVFGHHPRDGAPQGLFCANGQCAQCLVIAGGKPVKACVARVRPGLAIEPAEGLPALPPAAPLPAPEPTPELRTRVLIIGGGPAGLSAGRELDALGVDAILVDDKPSLGGKLVLQTHRFFGSFNAVHAGSRGIDIASRLAREARESPRLSIFSATTALAVFSDRRVGVLRGDGDGGGQYLLIRPEALLVAAGARERFLAFPGNTLPGVMGAGAFQTLMNRDLVRPAERVLVVGGGNVGLITAWHALQAGIEVVALIEALPACGGYAVHRDKLARQGVPILPSHTLVAAHGREGVEGATIAAVDASFRPIPGSERTFACDAVLLAVGLDPIDELLHKARDFRLPAFAAGDADQVAEASAAMFAGRIRAHEIARALGADAPEADTRWHRSLAIMRSRPGPTHEEQRPPEEGVVPVLHCVQEVPCDPCASVCPQAAIHIDPDDIRAVPAFIAEELGARCIACEKCVTICPGQAITLVDYRKDPEHPTVIVPVEMEPGELVEGGLATAVDIDGNLLGDAEVARIRGGLATDRTFSVKLRVPRAWAQSVAGIRLHRPATEAMPPAFEPTLTGDTIVCRCERVTADALRDLVRRGYHDRNEIKILSRAGLGACGAATCGPLVRRILREGGVPDAEAGEPLRRPLLVEVPLGALAGLPEGHG
ncbi:MAG: FAD-dependent oxidoreductase [Byssovorax sp.]